MILRIDQGKPEKWANRKSENMLEELLTAEEVPKILEVDSRPTKGRMLR